MRRHYATEMQLILAALIVSSGLTFVQPNHQMGKNAADTNTNDESGIQANFHNFFNSITNNDEKRTQNYRIILEQDAVEERRAFDAMKEDLQFARQRNAYKQRKVNPKDSNVIVVKRETPEAIYDGWIRSQTLTTNYYLTLPRRTVAMTQTQTQPTPQATPQTTPRPIPQASPQPIPQPTPSPKLTPSPTEKFLNDSKYNAVLGFKIIDLQYATMRPSKKYPEFSRIRQDAIFLQYFSQLKQQSNATEDLLPETNNYFELWPKVSVDEWKDQLSPDEMYRYFEFAEKYETEPPSLTLRWTILVTWLMRSTEWRNPAKVPEPMLSRFILLAQEYNRLAEVRRIKIVEIGKGVVQAFLNGFSY